MMQLVPLAVLALTLAPSGGAGGRFHHPWCGTSLIVPGPPVTLRPAEHSRAGEFIGEDPGFMPRERGGLVFTVNSFTAMTAYTHDPGRTHAGAADGERGPFRMTRKISIYGMITDATGEVAFRVRPPVITLARDRFGRDLTTLARINASPSNIRGPGSIHVPDVHGSPRATGWSVELTGLDAFPEALSGLAGYVDVEVVEGVESVDIAPEVSDEPRTIAPGVTCRVTRFGLADGVASIALTYRMELGAAARGIAGVVAMELLDPKGDVIYAAYPEEVATDRGVLGVVRANVGLGSRELSRVRLRLVCAARVERFEFQFGPLPLAGK